MVLMKNYKKLALLFLLSTFPAFAQGNKPLDGLNIMLDPGHGGADSGAVGHLGLKESETNLRVARYLKMLLEHDGANVTLTRAKDKALSLSKRVELSNEAMPDLFISIHHNASLNPKPKNHTEIYYNALDNGVPNYVGKHLTEGFEEAKFTDYSKKIPAGFYVLRNNNAPAILTEGSYISVPESEKNLRSGKGLTNEAAILWKAIRKAYEKGHLKIDLYNGTENNLVLDGPYFNILFTANKAVKNVYAKIDNSNDANVDIKNIMAYPMTYSLYNTTPLKSGNYELTMMAESYEGIPSAKKKVNLAVNLPVNKILIKPVAQYVPMGFKGRFPIDIILLDEQNNVNSRSIKGKLELNDKSSDFTTDKSGISTALIELKGDETKEIRVGFTADNGVEASLSIPVAMPIQRFVLGKLSGFHEMPIPNAVIRHNNQVIAKTNQKGFFYFDYPINTKEFEIEVQPGLGHNSFTQTLTTDGEPVILPILEAKAVSPALLNKKIAIMAPNTLDSMVSNLTKPLAYSGAQVSRLNMPENMDRPEYQSVLEANMIKNLYLLISMKVENIKDIQIRHYHSSKNGKKLADAVKNTFMQNYPNISVKSCVGSDYELGHTGATAIVIAIPSQPDENTREALVNQVSHALKNN